MHDLNTAGDSFEVTMLVPGVNVVNVTPNGYQEDTGNAVANHAATPGSVSGFKLTPYPSTDFTAGGHFGLLESLVIIQLPTVAIRYSSGSASDAASSLTEHASVGVSFLGIPLAGPRRAAATPRSSRTSSRSASPIPACRSQLGTCTARGVAASGRRFL